jgi:hypothetical protein
MHALAAIAFSFHPKESGVLLGEGAIMVVGPQSSKQGPAEERLEMAALPASAHESDGPRAVSAVDLVQFGGDFIQRLFPGDAFKAVPHVFQRKLQPLRVILKKSNVCSLAADETAGTGVFPIRPGLEDLAPFHNDFQAAVLRAKHTGGLLPFSHINFSSLYQARYCQNLTTEDPEKLSIFRELG